MGVTGWAILRALADGLNSRIRARSGWSKAIVATVQKILVIAYGILKTKLPYQDLGDDYYDRLNPDRTMRRVQKRMAKLGYQVSLTPMPEPTIQTT